MKKLVFLLVCLFTLQTVARADDDKPIQVTQMPQPAQQFIKQHFADSKVALAKMESDFFYKSYEVIFTNGNKVEFGKNGNWEEVNCKYTSVPTAIIPTTIQKYVTTNYPDTRVLKIDSKGLFYIRKDCQMSHRIPLGKITDCTILINIGYFRFTDRSYNLKYFFFYVHFLLLKNCYTYFTPPSTRTTCPLMNEASFDARK